MGALNTFFNYRSSRHNKATARATAVLAHGERVRALHAQGHVQLDATPARVRAAEQGLAREQRADDKVRLRGLRQAQQDAALKEREEGGDRAGLWFLAVLAAILIPLAIVVSHPVMTWCVVVLVGAALYSVLSRAADATAAENRRRKAEAVGRR